MIERLFIFRNAHDFDG